MKSTLTEQIKQSEITQDMNQKVLKDEIKKAEINILDKDLKKALDCTSWLKYSLSIKK